MSAELQTGLKIISGLLPQKEDTEGFGGARIRLLLLFLNMGNTFRCALLM